MSHECTGCEEYRELSRRQFLIAAGGTTAALAAPAWLPRIVLAESECSNRDVIISIFLRGASDGLTMCVPFGEAAYYTNRPTLAIPQPDSGDPFAATDLDGFFGLPPAMTAVLPAYNNGDLLIVHACGSTDPSRSHFDAQRFMEDGKPGDNTIYTGWLGRHLATAPPINPNAQLRSIGIAYGLQRTLQGGPLSLPIPNLDTFGLTGSSSTVAARTDALGDMYALVADPLKAAAQTTQATIDLLNTIDFAGYVPAGGAVYPSGSFGTAIKSTAALIKADVGVEAVAIDVGGWDTHNNQGTKTGTMANLMTTLAAGLAAFHADMWAGNGRNVTVVVMSEFGRRLLENGSIGTDHGHGNAMLVLGNHIAGGRVLTQWPGLSPGQLYQNRDLEVTIDFRDVLAEIVRFRLANPNLANVFPDYTPTFRGVTVNCQPGDVVRDGLVDEADLTAFAACATRAAVPYDPQNLPPGCTLTADPSGKLPVDFDADGDLDPNDFAVMQRCYGGQTPANPHCTD